MPKCISTNPTFSNNSKQKSKINKQIFQNFILSYIKYPPKIGKTHLVPPSSLASFAQKPVSQAMGPLWHQGTMAPRALQKSIKRIVGKILQSKS